MTTTASLLSAVFICSMIGGYGDPSTGYDNYPSWQERSLLVLTNACRISPVAYRDTFLKNATILLPANYPAVQPVYWNLGLNRSAREHAVDMANNCGLQHNSCNGTTWDIRIKTYYKTSLNIGENIAYSKSGPFETMKQWLFEGTTPVADKSGSDGHRKNIMNVNYNEIGPGYATGPQGGGQSGVNPYWVQDFGGAESRYKPFPVPSGSHFFITSGFTTFLANYYSNGAPKIAEVVVGTVTIPMTLHIGKAEKGTYIARIPSTGACRNYFFKFTDTTGTAYRYPQEGAFVIFGDGLCTQNYTGALSFRSRTPEKNPGIKRIVRVFKAGKVLIGVSVPGLNGYYDIRGLHLRPGRQAGSLFRHAPGL